MIQHVKFLMTFEPEDMAHAMECCRSPMHLCSLLKKSLGLSETLGKMTTQTRLLGRLKSHLIQVNSSSTKIFLLDFAGRAKRSYRSTCPSLLQAEVRTNWLTFRLGDLPTMPLLFHSMVTTMHNPLSELVPIAVGRMSLLQEGDRALAAIDGNERAIRNLVERGRQLNCR
jgi:hypothetical protein